MRISCARFNFFLLHIRLPQFLVFFSTAWFGILIILFDPVTVSDTFLFIYISVPVRRKLITGLSEQEMDFWKEFVTVVFQKRSFKVEDSAYILKIKIYIGYLLNFVSEIQLLFFRELT